jgi:hypothetical protein
MERAVFKDGPFPTFETKFSAAVRFAEPAVREPPSTAICLMTTAGESPP